MRSLVAVKKNFRALGQQIEGTGAQVVFSSIPLVAGRNAERSRRNPPDEHVRPSKESWLL